MTLPLPSGVTREELQHAFQHLLNHSPHTHVHSPLRRPTPNHECSPLCHFVVDGSVHICKASNNLHCCSSAICNELIADHDEETQVCRITNNCYPLDFVLSAEMESNRPQVDRSQLKEKFHIVAGLEPKSNKRTRQQYEADVMEKNRLDTIHVLQQVMSVFKTATGMTLYEYKHVVDEVRKNADDLWLAITRTKQYQKCKTYSYRHKYHVLTVLYHAITGFSTSQGKCLVTQHDIIKRYLTPFKDLSKETSLKDLDVSTFTKTRTMFRKCLQEIHECK